jgi:hypothetical protein
MIMPCFPFGKERKRAEEGGDSHKYAECSVVVEWSQLADQQEQKTDD